MTLLSTFSWYVYYPLPFSFYFISRPHFHAFCYILCARCAYRFFCVCSVVVYRPRFLFAFRFALRCSVSHFAFRFLVTPVAFPFAGPPPVCARPPPFSQGPFHGMDLVSAASRFVPVSLSISLRDFSLLRVSATCDTHGAPFRQLASYSVGTRTLLHGVFVLSFGFSGVYICCYLFTAVEYFILILPHSLHAWVFLAPPPHQVCVPHCALSADKHSVRRASHRLGDCFVVSVQHPAACISREHSLNLRFAFSFSYACVFVRFIRQVKCCIFAYTVRLGIPQDSCRLGTITPIKSVALRFHRQDADFYSRRARVRKLIAPAFFSFRLRCDSMRISRRTRTAEYQSVCAVHCLLR